MCFEHVLALIPVCCVISFRLVRPAAMARTCVHVRELRPDASAGDVAQRQTWREEPPLYDLPEGRTEEIDVVEGHPSEDHVHPHLVQIVHLRMEQTRVEERHLPHLHAPSEPVVERIGVVLHDVQHGRHLGSAQDYLRSCLRQGTIYEPLQHAVGMLQRLGHVGILVYDDQGGGLRADPSYRVQESGQRLRTVLDREGLAHIRHGTLDYRLLRSLDSLYVDGPVSRCDVTEEGRLANLAHAVHGTSAHGGIRDERLELLDLHISADESDH